MFRDLRHFHVCVDCTSEVDELISDSENWHYGLLVDHQINIIVSTIDELIAKQKEYANLPTEYYVIPNTLYNKLLQKESLDLAKYLPKSFPVGKLFSKQDIEKITRLTIKEMNGREYEWEAPYDLLERFRINLDIDINYAQHKDSVAARLISGIRKKHKTMSK